MRVQLKERTDWDDNPNGYFDVHLNGRPVENDAMSISLTNEFNEIGFANIKVICPNGGMEIITGTTKTGKVFEIYGGRKAGGSRNQWYLEVDGICVGFEKNAKHLIQILCSVTWDETQIDFSNNLYQRQIERENREYQKKKEARLEREYQKYINKGEA